MEVLKLKPAGKNYLWGGTRLREEYGKKLQLTPLAETWECSVHPDGFSVVVNGTYAGWTLADVLKKHPEYMGTNVVPEEGLPILVKLIDAKKDLSVQVHPDDAYAREHEHQNGKTELWYVLDAKEDASIVYGFEQTVTEEVLREALADGSLDKYLHKIKVNRGDVYYVPAGTVHGIGAGILLVEVQESSNVTYRIYDYDRMDENGKKRELHFDQAVRVMNMHPMSQTKQLPCPISDETGCHWERLCKCEYFETERICMTTGCVFEVQDTSFQVLLCLSGDGIIETDGECSVGFVKGECIFIPSGIGMCRLSGKAELLKIRC